eukprot:JP448546.1.p1 GENE.JP448546.1~~JP448546.1.p1  ORF type:complete len:104 (+),score=37.43 JP448546.1:29-340(+)
MRYFLPCLCLYVVCTLAFPLSDFDSEHFNLEDDVELAENLDSTFTALSEEPSDLEDDEDAAAPEEVAASEIDEEFPEDGEGNFDIETSMEDVGSIRNDEAPYL